MNAFFQNKNTKFFEDMEFLLKIKKKLCTIKKIRVNFLLLR